MKIITKGNWGGRVKGCGGYINVSGTSSDRVNTNTLSTEKKSRKKKEIQPKLGNDFYDVMRKLRNKKKI